MAIFRLLVLRGKGPYWWEYNPKTDYYSNEAGNEIAAHPNHFIIAEAEANDFEDLDWHKTALVDPDPEDPSIGWIDRNGKHYPCTYENHDEFVDKILKTTVQELEEHGWIRVYGKRNQGYEIMHGFENDYQKNTLRDLGYEVAE
jgi:hypothetical protein